MSDSETLKRIEKLLDSLVRLQGAPILAAELKKPELAKIWNLTGQLGAREIGTKLGIGKDRVSDVWLRWTAMGLVRKVGKTYEKIIDQ